jgi:ribosomal protein S18 acetylase RimI-like enzyme
MGSMGGAGSESASEETVATRLGSDDDAGIAASLHASQIDAGFLSLLGEGFLTRLYRRIVRTSGCFLVMAEVEGVPVGFVAGSDSVSSLYRTFLLHDGLAAAAGAARPIIANWRRVAETLRHGSSGSVGTGHGVELLAIAVDPRVQGRGIGRQLVTAFLGQVESGGGTAAYVVVAAGNAAAVGLYRAAGFTDETAFELHAGVTSLLMQWPS